MESCTDTHLRAVSWLHISGCYVEWRVVQTHTSEQCHGYTYQVAMWNGELHKLVCVRVCIKMYNVVTFADAVYVLMK